MFKNMLTKAGAALGVIGAFLGVQAARASDVADFTAATASTTANQDAISPIIMSFITSTGGKALIIGVLVTLTLMGITWIKIAISGKKKKK
jgi:parvulin-like peptidyl-prolyl isomerase